MKLFRSLAALACAALAISASPAAVQAQDRAVVTAACSISYTAGETRPMTMNTSGQLCTSGSGGGSAGATGPGTAATASRVTYASDGSTVPVAGTVTANQGTAGATSWLTADQNIAQSSPLIAAATLTRPADTTAYTGLTSATQGDLIANSTTAGSVTPLSFAIPAVSGTGTAEGYLTGLAIRESTRRAQHTIRVHLFQTTAPTVSSGDNAAIVVSNYSSGTYLGYADVIMDPGPMGNAGFTDDLLIPYSKTSAATIYVLLEAYTGFTPASAETFDVRVFPTRVR